MTKNELLPKSVGIKLVSLDVRHNLPQTTNEYQPDKPPMKVAVSLWAHVKVKNGRDDAGRSVRFGGDVSGTRVRIFENAPDQKVYPLNKLMTIPVNPDDIDIEATVYIDGAAWGVMLVKGPDGRPKIPHEYYEGGIFTTEPPAEVGISVLRAGDKWAFPSNSKSPLEFSSTYRHGDTPYIGGYLAFDLTFNRGDE
ncbi:MAG: hypothetical protein QOE96_3036 [Blastocatellia bacterium]|jgi:hypothetical protein|nr:hypothetical protein [Blastocatellia bacterium]